MTTLRIAARSITSATLARPNHTFSPVFISAVSSIRTVLGTPSPTSRSAINGSYASVNTAELAHAPASTINSPSNANDSAAAVDCAHAAGYDFIKLYQFLNRKIYVPS